MTEGTGTAFSVPSFCIMKKIVTLLYILVIIVLAATTLVENIYSTSLVNQYFYGSWWFNLLWALLAASGTAYIIRQKMKKWNIVLLHLSFVVILAGAFLTHITSFRGMVHLRGDQPTNLYATMLSMTETQQGTLPFYVKLNRFSIVQHAGTAAPADYITQFSIVDGAKTIRTQVSMNKVTTYRGIRFYQASYDQDNRGSYLSVNSDPYGIPITYMGYAMLFFSLIWLLIDPRGTFRRLLKSPLLQKSALTVVLFFSIVFSGLAGGSSGNAHAATLVPESTAYRIGELYIDYNDRICPMQTFAYDFVKKIYGKRSYKGSTPEQVLASWIFYFNEWCSEPFVRVKSSELREHLSLDKYTSVNSFFRQGSYILGQYVAEYSEGHQDAFHKACADMDSRLQVIMSLRNGAPLRIFPHTSENGCTEWFSPFEEYPKALGRENILFFKNVFPLVYGQLIRGNIGGADTILDKIRAYQEGNAGSSLPSETQVKAERINNAIPFATILFMVNLTLGFLTLFLLIRALANPDRKILGMSHGIWLHGLQTLLTVSFLMLTFCLILRWIISGNIPLSNGYESMLSVAWFVLLIALLLPYRLSALPSYYLTLFGFLLSGFFLLVSHINQMDPAIGHIMPVLNSPLLGIHVSIIMMSYALLALTFICSMIGLWLKGQADMLQVLSRIFLYPAITTMGLGIFIGAIWANISWGTYWSWDPKETWALITFMIYAVVLHTQSFPLFCRPKAYHLYMVFAFLSIIMTYFGVNYILGGMHSYA